MEFKHRYKKLNDRQRQAVDTIDGPVMVIAGPGTGKTELLSMRAANILRCTDAAPENILCLTFTDSGANAMRERLTKIIGPAAYKIAIHTFHSLGTEIISHHGKFFYQGAYFRPADDLASYELLRSIFAELSHDNPLASTANGEYTHLADVQSCISELKKSGLTSDELLAVLDANEQVVDTVEPALRDIFTTRVSKATPQAIQIHLDDIFASGRELAIPGITPLSQVIGDSLQAALDEYTTSGKTTPLSKWRSTWLKKNEAGELILKTRERITKLRSLSHIYYQYLARMHEAELYDFDDMILRVVHAIEVFPELRYNLQEKYQYIMIDEFQDTNLAQLRIITNLANNPANNGRPNIMAVGDDDQAIYSFQGADVGNIHAFDTTYNPVRITLTDNYRSAAIVLDHARSVITQGTDRLENTLPELNKTLTPHFTPDQSTVSLIEHQTAHDEYEWLVSTIARQVQNGTPADTIAILARRHHEIEALLPYFAKAGLAVNYERRDNVLEQPLIKTIELTARIAQALQTGDHTLANSLLPELLAHPAFTISPVTLWKLSVQSYTSRQSWMELLAATPEFIDLHEWLTRLAYDSSHLALEHTIDLILGTPNATVNAEQAFISPLYAHCFGDTQLHNNTQEYLTLLGGLRTIRSKLRDYQPGQTPLLADFLRFIQLHRQLGKPIKAEHEYTDHIGGAINLMTAHKSKGLEFDHVYITGSIDTAWGERVRSRSRMISYPENLALAPAGDSLNERLRLFYVAMTRAKKTLTISYSTVSEAGKDTLRASFLTIDPWQATVAPRHNTPIDQINSSQIAWYQPIIQPITRPMQDILAPILANYKLSATHLTTFLDIAHAGPQVFLLQNLLKFPQPIHAEAEYGTAIHTSLQRAHSHLAATDSLQPVEDILGNFEETLRASRLNDTQINHYLQKGSSALSSFLTARYHTFTPTQKVELSFAGQGSMLGDVRLTGALDVVDIHDRHMTITDYKTARPSLSWTGKSDYEKIKLHHYRQQLMFYQLLVQHSRDYHTHTVDKVAIQFVEPTKTGDIITLDTSFTADELEQFSRLITAVWQRIMQLDLPDISRFSPNYKGILAFEASLLDNPIDVIDNDT